MLHENVLMADIDVDQWRNAQALLLRSAKATRRLVVIHDHGTVVKFRHTSDETVTGQVTQVDDPHALAKSLYEANKEVVDFVVIMERSAVDDYFAAMQDSWDIEEDLDVFVRRTHALLEEYADGIVTYPGPARDTLGLQWRFGAPFEAIDAAVRRRVAPGSTVVLGVHDNGALWTSLIIDFDASRKVASITTADPSLVDIHGARDEVLARLTAWQAATGKDVSIALSFDHDAVEEFIAGPVVDKERVLGALVAAHRVSIG